MNAIQSTTASAVVTRLHDVGRSSEKSGVGGRGCVRGAGRQHASYMTVVDAPVGANGGSNGGSAYGEVMGERKVPAQSVDAETAFTAYVRERRASLYATAYHLTGDRFEAEDLLQSALFSTYRAWDRISDKAAVGGYLRRTMTNLHISAWRRRKLNEYPTEELPETAGDTDAMRGTELRAVLWQALARLPELQRTMLVLRYYEGRTDPEIAAILDISVGTVKSSIWRSLRRLRDDEVLSFGRDQEESFGELVA
ncbi:MULTISPECIES: SigE family RNA polymerase sigma factor [unclassified Streptomyces]|uniref:SigE family RNA polymerase sigma factor n=1 Tax=unclassified Streptomyces TaxID=2593676 RepID=UPI0022586CCF|nr:MULTISPECIES: SigE family RNA polymerase sigma factor [unclassified Streptomyces]WSP57090.1 SigE family RNA polymerase sigma factor [Streptomyces sp. NBC_01241]WSU22191.1 SigE family RNA polymerase sigma factor [Streptomyces sp. NBC_01108]MCX4788893.1 SigE family RNA polymerase sigma factor [Streptomyces sp. NBC_01221]WSJ36664.1 SigE family RNA polymerase sigma factor [Streptomyces sp. NBC_01321]WSP63082.1 SigE family RNA polymerase sigma factor [Streptomyces sp. NBC_01240]